MKKNQATFISTLLFLCLGCAVVHADHGFLFGADLDHVLHFPHFGNGESIRSELVLVNLGSTAPAIVSFHGEDGEMIQADSLVEMTEELMFLDDGAIDTGDISHLGEITISTNGSGEWVPVFRLTETATAAITCTYTGQQEAETNKICYYDCAGSPAAITVKSHEVCPVTIQEP